MMQFLDQLSFALNYVEDFLWCFVGFPIIIILGAYLTYRSRFLQIRKLPLIFATFGNYKGERLCLMKVFGTRWIPFEKEISGCSAPAKSFGIHGAPWKEDPVSGKLVETRDQATGFVSDGCIRLKKEDVEELFAIITTKPTEIEILLDAKSSSILQNWKIVEEE